MKNIKMYSLCDGNYDGLILRKYKDVLDWIEASLESAEAGECFDFSIEVVEYTEEQYANLPDAD